MKFLFAVFLLTSTVEIVYGDLESPEWCNPGECYDNLGNKIPYWEIA